MADQWGNYGCLYIYTYIYILMDPSIFLGSVWGMIWRVKYLLRQCLDA